MLEVPTSQASEPPQREASPGEGDPVSAPAWETSLGGTQTDTQDLQGTPAITGCISMQQKKGKDRW